MCVSRSSRPAFRSAGIAIVLSASITGCTGTLAIPAGNAAAISGNWQMSATVAGASTLPVISGSLTGSGSTVAGILHANTTGACVSMTTPIVVTGSVASGQAVSLTGAVAGGTLTLTGTLSADGKSLTNAGYSVAGGSCATSAKVNATAQAYADISGNYTGTFSDPDGQVIAISASLTQTPTSDTDGNYQLSGSGTFPSNPCFSSPVSIASSQVTGGSFTQTYKDTVTTNSVTASGTFSTDGTTLTVTKWTLTGPCGPDAGTGLLTKTVTN